METQDLLKIGIGTKENVTLKPAKVKIVSVKLKEETNDGRKMSTPLAYFECKHPDKDELVSISKVKLEKNGKLQVVGIWVQLDEDGKLKKSSAISQILNYLNASTIEETFGKEIETIRQSEDNQYLCLKAY